VSKVNAAVHEQIRGHESRTDLSGRFEEDLRGTNFGDAGIILVFRFCVFNLSINATGKCFEKSVLVACGERTEPVKKLIDSAMLFQIQVRPTMRVCKEIVHVVRGELYRRTRKLQLRRR